MLNFLNDDVRRHPYPLYDQLRSASPLFKVPGIDVWMLFDYENVRQALHDPATFSSRAAPPGDKPIDWMIFHDPPHHTRLRAIISKAFTPKSVANLEPRILERSRELLDLVIERETMDLAMEFSSPLPLMVIAEMIGIPGEDWLRFRRWSDAVLRLSDAVLGDAETKERGALEFRAASVEMREYLEELTALRRAAPRDDLLTRLVQAEVEGERLTSEEILAFFQLLLVAGSETTTNLISNAVLSLMEHPDQLERLRAMPALLPQAIEEVLRYRSPLQAVFRQTTRPVEVHGQEIPADKLVLLLVGSANRDPSVFPDPDRFDITREPNPHIAFGHGIHFCLGAPLARLEARVALGHLLERLEHFELTGDKPWEPRKAFHVHGPNRLPIRFRARG